MFKLVLLFTMALATASAQLSSQNIEDNIRSLQGSRPGVLNQNVLDTDGSYQRSAMLDTIANLKNRAGVAIFQVREYYTLACIYHATNGKSNPRTNAIIPGQDLPEWSRIDEWITNPDYCQWFGVSCFNSQSDQTTQVAQEGEKKVVEINLNENNLYGTFPNEIALIGNTLAALDLYNNFFQWCGDYRWMPAMTVIEALFVGSTSWDADGIPLNLRFMTTLQELDISNTFWRGVLTENAFNNLKQLRYLDLGQNFYDFTNIDTIPDFITGLPLLTNLYIDSIRPTPNSPPSQNKLTMDFIARMPNLIELWMDYTNVRGPLPSDIGEAKNLQSLSCVYCKLDGSIPDSIVDTALDRLWVYGNPELEGPFPANFGSLDWRYLYIEGTKITESIPKSICEQRGTDETQDLLELGADCDICPTGCCTCCGDDCNNLRSPTPAPTGGDDPFICFAGDSQVDVEDRGLIKMSDLALGDSVKVADGKYEPVYSFGHKNKHEVGKFLAINAEGNRKLELSEDHMVTMEGGRIVPASMVQIGDKLLTASGAHAAVKTIRTVTRKGVYAPFTMSGSIVVNDIVASNYVAFQGEEYLHIAGFETPLNYHWMAHIFNSVHRIVYKMGLTSETYTEDGTSNWVAGPREMGAWLLEQNPVVTALGLIAYVFIFGVTSIVESLMMGNQMALVTVSVGALSWIASRRAVSLKIGNVKSM